MAIEAGIAREARTSEWREIGRCLALAFEDDPIAKFLFPEPGSRLRRLDSFYRKVLRLMAAHGAIYTSDGVRGASIWQAPSPPQQSRLEVVAGFLFMLTTLRTASARAMRVQRAVVDAHIREPHWYLAVLGTEPASQGKGIGSGLMRPMLERCDAENLRAYLESSKEQNIPFYERHGFEITEEIRVSGGPTLWAMVRTPRGRPVADAASDAGR